MKNATVVAPRNLKAFGKIEFLTSDDFHLFNFIDFNRKIDTSHVSAIEDSIKQHGFKGCIQVIKTDIWDGVKKLYILDGQHRFSACKRLNIPFAFELTEFDSQEETVEFIAELNNSQKRWGTSQFLTVWAGLNRKEYVKLRSVFEATGFQITPLIEAYTFASRHVEFRKGKLKFPNEKESDKIIAQMVDLNPFLPKKAFVRRALVKLLRQDKYKHAKMKTKVSEYRGMGFKFPENEADFTEKFQTLIDNC